MIILFKAWRKVLLLMTFIIIMGMPLLRVEAQDQGAKVWISPSNETRNIGDIFSVNLYVTSLHRPMNALEGGLQFFSKNIELTGISKEGSIFSFWTEEPFFSNKTGTITFSGGLQSPGFTGAAGKILSLNFRAISGGPASIIWGDAAVLANDGNGTNILIGKENANFSIIPKIVEAPSLYTNMVYIILASVIAIALVILLLFRKKLPNMSRVNKGKISIETLVEEKFSNISKDISEELWRLEGKLKRGDPFSKEERERREQLLRGLGNNAKEIKNKINNI